MPSSPVKPDAPHDTQEGSQLAQELIVQAKAAASSDRSESQAPQLHTPSDAASNPRPRQENHSHEAYVVVVDKTTHF